jgi:hypothetical protein
MQAHRIETTTTADGTLTLTGLPIPAGASLEVIILVREPSEREQSKEEHGPENRYPLRSTPYRYENPTASVALDEWEAVQ